ncbi:hypothetical protein TWF696_007807 [Orbilia brochopaga]|uniref:Uncharacterized protein n=1 Tax=Orbilia brochopaga TaxID=3140254 RepID=A0AAV9UM52_9PEZI
MLSGSNAVIRLCNLTDPAQHWLVMGTAHSRYRYTVGDSGKDTTSIPRNERTIYTGTIVNNATKRCLYTELFGPGESVRPSNAPEPNLYNAHGRLYMAICKGLGLGFPSVEIDPYNDINENMVPRWPHPPQHNVTRGPKDINVNSVDWSDVNDRDLYACTNKTHTKAFLIPQPIPPGSGDLTIPAHFGCAAFISSNTDSSAIMGPSPRLLWLHRARGQYNCHMSEKEKYDAAMKEYNSMDATGLRLQWMACKTAWDKGSGIAAKILGCDRLDRNKEPPPEPEKPTYETCDQYKYLEFAPTT